MTPESTFESALADVIARVRPLPADAQEPAWERLDSLTKPPRSLGVLEQVAARVAAVQGDTRPAVARKAVVVAAGNHGVVAQGVSAFPAEVTPQMVVNFAHGGAAINAIARSVGADVVVYDVGVAADLSQVDGIVHAKVAPGTRDMTAGPAMTREEAAQAVMVGVNAARELAEQGYALLGTGEMGIGNSTAAAALTCVFAGATPQQATGRGTGVDDAAYLRKTEVIAEALAVNGVEDLDPLGVLAAVGGLEIAALAGVIIGSAEQRVCVVSDGYISGAATLAAVALCPAARDYVFPSHLSAEPGHALALDALGLEPLLRLDMRLGEGTGACLAFGIMDAACSVISTMATFAEAGVSTAGD